MDFQKEPGRLYAMEGGKLVAEILFPGDGDRAVITRTFVDDSLRGQGVASKLVAAAVEELRAEGKKVDVTCSYAAEWFRHHPEASDLR